MLAYQCTLTEVDNEQNLWARSMHPCVVQRHCECLPDKDVIINEAVRKKGPPILQGVNPVEAKILRFYILLWVKQYRTSWVRNCRTGSQAL